MPSNVRNAIRNGGKFKESRNDIHRTIVFGDERTAQFPQYFAIVAVWIKFHNRVVDELSRLYPSLPADVKFYEARRFVIAVYQNIFYNEVIPLVVSARNVEKYDLTGRTKCYDPSVDPSVITFFFQSEHIFIEDFFTR